MARKVKFEPAIARQRERQEKRRLEGQKAKRLWYLIVCEGEKTEPNYFTSLKESLPKGVLDVYKIDIDGTGYNTESLVNKAIQLKAKYERDSIGRLIDKLWVVFDRDSFIPQAFNNAIQRCKRKHFDNCKVEAAWSNEAFELWYLLHFHYYNTGISRAQYQSLIEKNFRDKGIVNYVYQKNSTEMFNLLEQYGDKNKAVRYARQLRETYNGEQNYADHNPCTTVDKLVAELLNLEE